MNECEARNMPSSQSWVTGMKYAVTGKTKIAGVCTVESGGRLLHGHRMDYLLPRVTSCSSSLLPAIGEEAGCSPWLRRPS
jgi:hypothetical protein